MKIKTLLCGIGIMALSSCAGEKAEKLDVDKALSYCDVQVHRALAELGKNGEADYSMQPRNILSGEKFWNCRKVAKEEWTGGAGRVFCGMIMKLHKMIRFVCWLKSIQNR